MRHRMQKSHFNRNTNERKALLKSLITALIEQGEIVTTHSKAKAIKGVTDKLVHRAQYGTVAVRRLLAKFFGRRDIVNKLVDELAPAMNDRQSGFTRITPVGKRRGDNTEMVKMEFVTKVQVTEVVKEKESASQQPISSEQKPIEKKKTAVKKTMAKKPTQNKAVKTKEALSQEK